jgi:hypothetical protein
MARVKIQIQYDDDDDEVQALPSALPSSLTPLRFEAVALRLHPKDSVAIATATLPAGSLVKMNLQDNDDTTTTVLTISHQILVGHRFAIRNIPHGQPVLSWSYPFGRASQHISPGTYLVNATMIDSLTKHGIDPSQLPSVANFVDEIVP